MYLQSIKYVKHNAAKSVNWSIFKKSRHIGFGVFIVHSSMHTIRARIEQTTFCGVKINAEAEKPGGDYANLQTSKQANMPEIFLLENVM
jgi:hypothetical protein